MGNKQAEQALPQTDIRAAQTGTMSSRLKSVLVSLYDWLGRSDPGRIDADLIFTLAGQQERKQYALQVFSGGQIPNLVLSVGRFELRRFGNLPVTPLIWQELTRMAAPVAPHRRHAFVCFNHFDVNIEFVSKGFLGTLGEIVALRAWLAQRSEIQSVLFISSATHLRRVRLCCRRLLPRHIQLRLLAVEDDATHPLRSSWWKTRKSRSLVVSEIPKLVLYWIVLLPILKLGTWNFARRLMALRQAL